jgi:hypothetical protein
MVVPSKGIQWAISSLYIPRRLLNYVAAKVLSIIQYITHINILIYKLVDHKSTSEVILINV